MKIEADEYHIAGLYYKGEILAVINNTEDATEIIESVLEAHVKHPIELEFGETDSFVHPNPETKFSFLALYTIGPWEEVATIKWIPYFAS